MKFLSINNSNIDVLKNFILDLKVGVKGFRYYSSREFDVIKNHIYTCVLQVEEKTVCYGHLDKENSKVWLGICTADESLKMGYGTKMMKELFREAKKQKIETIHLSVDVGNIKAKRLYLNLGFVIDEEFSDYIRYKKNL